jgi:sugar phosphate isomerase/epimerase
MNLERLPGMSRRDFLKLSATAGVSMTALGASPLFGAQQNRNSKRPISVFSKHLQWLNYEDAADIAAEIGFDGLDLTVRPGGHVLPENVEEDLPRAVEAIKKAGLDTYMFTSAITHPDDEHTEPVLRTASELGFTHYRTGYLSYKDNRGIMESIKSYRPQWRDLMAMNKEFGLHGGYQNHAGARLGGPVWDLHELLDGMDPEFIGVQYDVRHATVEGGNSWRLGMELVHPFIQTTVIKDFVWGQRENGRWRPNSVPLEKGMVQWEDYWELVSKLGISGPISVHYEYDMGGAEHGASEIDMSRKEFIKKMKRDLNVLKGWLDSYNLA